MQKTVFVLLVITLLWGNLLAEVIASVNNHQITYDMLEDKLTELEELDLSYKQVKDLALNTLINDALLLDFAIKNKIDIDQVELDAFFFSQLGEHPRFQQDGQFSEAKYNNFKFTNRGKKILKEMRQELLLSKVKTLVIKEFNLTDKSLYQNYLVENRDIEIDYTTIEIDKVNIPLHYSTEGAKKYYSKNKNNILKDEQIKLDFYYLPWDNYFLKAERTIATDTILVDSINVEYKQKVVERLALADAENLISRLANKQITVEPILSTGYIKADQSFGVIDSDVVKAAFESKPMDFNEITEIASGYLIYRVSDIIPPQPGTMDELKDKIWEAYIHDEKVKSKKQYEDIFIANIDQFIAPASIVEKIYINKPKLFSKQTKTEYQLEISEELIKYSDDSNKFNKFVKTNNLKTENSPIYLGEIKNSDLLDQLISKKLLAGRDQGIINYDDMLVFYREILYFPEYIPLIEDVIPSLQELISDTKFDDYILLDYYEKHKKDFVTQDSLKLGIVYFDKSIDNYSVSDSLLRSYYDQHNFYRDKSVKFDYIYSKDQARAYLISSYLDSGMDFDYIKTIYSEDLNLDSSKIRQYQDLPKAIADALEDSPKNIFTDPTAFDEGWILLRKTAEFQAGIPHFESLKAEIASTLTDQAAEKNAYLQAKTVFDSTRYLSQAYKYTDKSNIYKTELQIATQDYQFLGDISEHRKELLRIWGNEKYSSIIDTGDGFAVVYMIKKRSSKQLDFEQSKPLIKRLLMQQEQIEKAKKYTQRLSDRIAKGSDADRLLYFLGSWNHAKISSIEADIFGSKFSKLIIQDIAKREQGYISPVIKLEAERFLFYQISAMKKVTPKDFDENRELYRQKVIDQMMTRWYNKQRSLAIISIK